MRGVTEGVFAELRQEAKVDKIVILMATYQGEKYLEEQLRSITEQDYPDWELVVRDDGSSDRTLLLLSAYANRYPDRITVRRGEENLGGTKNFLTLLRDAAVRAESAAAKGERTYFMFSDQDDFWHPDKLRLTLFRMKQLEARYGADVPALVFTDARVVDEGRRELAPSFYGLQHFNLKKRTLPHLLMENMVIGCTAMMNAALAGLVERLPEHARYHDWWMALLAAAFGHTSYLPVATLDYRQHGNNVVGAQGFGRYAGRRAAALLAQRKTLRANYRQAKEFFELYGGRLPGHPAGQLAAFLALPDENFIARRVDALRGGYLKSGLVRNIGLFMIL